MTKVRRFSLRAVPLRDAKRDAVVTVNGERAERDSGTAYFTPWSYSLPSDSATAHFQNADILAVAKSASGEDVEQSASGSMFIPADETFLEYDDDGNMTFDGRFRYTWNGENRMIRAVEAVVPTNRPATTIGYAYDHQGRMVAKNIAGTNTIARALLWDDYDIIRETDNGIDTYNVWGLDLDGTLQGCGGVGGLLCVAKTDGIHVAFYDVNGNIDGYVKNNGEVSAHYAYSPFGEVAATGNEYFTHQFSTKPFGQVLHFIEYQKRFLNPCLGRWMSRDFMEESGEKNLLRFCHNNSNSFIDFLGLCVQIITAGDSLTYGSTGWANRSTEHLPGYLNSLNVSNPCQEICMFGKNGAKTHEISKTKTGNCSCLTSCPDAFFVIVMTGMNDALGFQKNDADVRQGKYKQRQEALVNRAKKGWDGLRKSLIDQVTAMTPADCSPRKVMIIVEVPYVGGNLKADYNEYTKYIDSILASIFDHIRENGPGEGWEVEYVRTNSYKEENGTQHDPEVPLVHTPDDDGIHFKNTDELSDYLEGIINGGNDGD